VNTGEIEARNGCLSLSGLVFLLLARTMGLRWRSAKSEKKAEFMAAVLSMCILPGPKLAREGELTINLLYFIVSRFVSVLVIVHSSML